MHHCQLIVERNKLVLKKQFENFAFLKGHMHN